MKRILLLLLSLCALVLFTSCKNNTSGETGADAELAYFEIDGGAAYAVCGLGSVTDTDIVIPPLYNGKPVTAIADRAFENCTKLTSISIPPSVTDIGISAFNNCSSLVSITLPFVGATLNGTDNTHFGYIFGAKEYGDNGSCVPASLHTVVITAECTISPYAFSGCDALSYIVMIPSTVTSIGSHAFEGCTALKPVKIPASVTYVGELVFEGCTQLIQKENGVSYVDKWVVDCDTGVTAATLRSDTVGVAKGAFSGCNALTSVTVPQSVSHIVDSAFYGCSSLTSITLPSAVTYIGDSAFYGCSSLASLTLPSTATSIGEAAFSGCSSLASITLPSAVAHIGDSAFYGCSGLTSLTIPSMVTSIGEAVFSGCSGLTSLTLPSTVTSIGEAAFSGCSNLLSIIIPPSVTEIGFSAFYNCSSLKSITLPFVGKMLNGTYHTHFGYIFGAQKYSDNGYYIPTSVSAVVITGDSRIKEYAFSGCGSLASITLSSSVTSIGWGAFENCSKLAEVSFEDNSRLTSIDSRAFYCCSSLAAIEIPSSVTSVSADVFSGCTLLMGEEDGVFYVDKWVVDCDTAVTAFTLRADTVGIAACAFEDCSMTSVSIPALVTSIGSYAFHGCEALASVTFAENSLLMRIGECAFYNCRVLASITIPPLVTSIGFETFCFCYELVSVTLSSSVTGIDNGAFAFCYSLTSITIPSAVTSIGSGAFEKCNRLSSAIFESTEGWCCTDFSDRRNDAEISSADLADSVKAAEYLVSAYIEYYWERTA